MIYVTGQHALNINCSLLTCGDWHQSALQWHSPSLRDSRESIYGTYGIETNKKIPEHIRKYNVANHIRALLDLLEMGKFTLAQGMNNDFICNDTYNNEIFTMVYKLRQSNNWSDIDKFMNKEYRNDWQKYRKEMEYDKLEG
ncbi:MAG: hypothetical protein PHX51_06675 [Clostridia bacterium]|nr:hypothetical protein [Clostridia bacterium]